MINKFGSHNLDEINRIIASEINKAKTVNVSLPHILTRKIGKLD